MERRLRDRHLAGRRGVQHIDQSLALPQKHQGTRARRALARLGPLPAGAVSAQALVAGGGAGGARAGDMHPYPKPAAWTVAGGGVPNGSGRVELGAGGADTIGVAFVVSSLCR
jgi:hypothetical protein